MKRTLLLRFLLLTEIPNEIDEFNSKKMRLNEHTIIRGNLVILVPYEEYHVPKYHEWMKSKELQLLTASEPLTLEEEYEMQRSWRADADKCTFMVLDKSVYDTLKSETEAMVGDTNIFLRKEGVLTIGEIEIMIAEPSARGKGLGKEALILMLRYGVENLCINIYEAKIKMNNIKSLFLFEKVEFEKVCENQVFQEIIFEKKVTNAWTQWLVSQTKYYSLEEKQ